MTSDDEYDYSEPWAIYDDQDRPWTDYDRLLELEDKLENQREIGDALGCHPNTISRHLQKAREWKHEQGLETGRICERCEEREVPGGADSGNSYCETCLDEVRG